ncbi:hypothetical protein C4564_01910 [Candidatus Microgenomates bacterium]|nr:MAG: hypothetical protein C4564_01910 [Candidatus Microgenomates bacterium]
MKPSTIKVALDSGAYSFFTRNTRGKPTALQNSFYKTKEFKQYLDRYIECLHEYGDKLTMYVVLDVIRNGNETMKIQKYMESCGLHPLPVFHVGSDKKILFSILDNYEYFCLGGIATKTSTKHHYSPYIDWAFKQICDSKGFPRVRVHGLAITGTVASRWPWYSMDSITWRYDGAVGQYKIPVVKNGSLMLQTIVTSPSRVHSSKHYARMPGVVQRFIDSYLNSIPGFSVAPTFEALSNSYQLRSLVAAYGYIKFFQHYRQLWKERIGFEGFNLFFAGDPLTNPQNRDMIEQMAKFGWCKNGPIAFETFFTSFVGKGEKSKKNRRLIRKYILGDRNANNSRAILRNPGAGKRRTA